MDDETEANLRFFNRIKEQFKEGTLVTPISKTFCVLPWIHVSTRPNGQLRVCCNANSSAANKDDNEYLKDAGIGLVRDNAGVPANLNSTRLKDAWNNDFMRNVRQTMLAGEIPRSCTKCFEEESHKIISKRLWETFYWSTRMDIKEIVDKTMTDGSLEPNIYYFDLRLGNLCNLRCAMCSPHDSSAWVPKWKNIRIHSDSEFVKAYSHSWDYDEQIANDKGVYDWYTNPEFMEDFFDQLAHVRQLYFAGGEPFIIQEHYRILEKCIELGYASNIEVRYNTNLTVLPNRLFDIWKHFKSVKVICSVDGYDKVNHYVRHPTKWKDIVGNLKRLDDAPDNIKITMACCINAFNVLNFDEFVKWKVSQNYKKINVWPNASGLINWHLVYTPSILNIRVLPLEKKELVKQRITDLKLWLLENYDDSDEFKNDPWGFAKFDGLIKYMFEEDWTGKLEDTRAFVRAIDIERGVNIEDHIPDAVFLKSK